MSLSQSALVINDPTVSRKHAELCVRNNELMITDLGSRNGTYVNEQRIGATSLGVGQFIRFGSVSFTVAEADASDMMVDSQEATDAPRDNVPVGGATLDAELVSQTQLSEGQRKVFELLL